jgi:hypothetical protein
LAPSLMVMSLSSVLSQRPFLTGGENGVPVTSAGVLH